MNRTAQLNSQAIDRVCHGDCIGAVRTLGSALSDITAKVTSRPPSPPEQDEETTTNSEQRPRSSTFRVNTSFHYLGVQTLKSSIAYFERPFEIKSFPSNGDEITDEQAAYLSSVVFYNMGLAMFVDYKKDTKDYERLLQAHDCFLRTYDVLSVCKLESDDSKLILMLATCNNLAAIHGDLGNIPMLHFWGDKFQVVLDFCDPSSHWEDANYHTFRMKKLLNAFSFSAASAA